MKRAIALCAVIVLLFTAGCQGSKKETNSDVTKENQKYKIGVVVSKTGEYAPFGLQEEKALMMEVERINKTGGVQGKNIELLVEDDASEPSNASIAISKLIDEDKVIAVIGSTSAPSILAMKLKAEEAKVPLMALESDTNITEAPSGYVFRVAQPEKIAVKKVLDYMYKELAQKFAVIYEETSYGKSGADELNKMARGARLSVTSTQSFEPENTDTIRQLKKIALTNPKAIVVWGSRQSVALVAKDMKELNIDIPLIGSPSIANKKFIELAELNAEGIVFPAGKMIVPDSVEGKQNDVINAFLKNYKKEYKEEPGVHAGYAYDAIYILKSALDETEGDTSLLVLKLNKTWGYVGVTGVFTYSKNDHDGIKGSDMIMVEVKDSEWVLKNL